MVNIVNVYQTTANHPEMQKRIYEALTRAINEEHEPCILVGDFNASSKDGRANYAPPHPQNFTTMADEAFADFVGIPRNYGLLREVRENKVKACDAASRERTGSDSFKHSRAETGAKRGSEKRTADHHS
jgi:endonuclease/exonuclease/phosphatase family metal-dependent hydrolase